jgi:hypothetical protein
MGIVKTVQSGGPLFNRPAHAAQNGPIGGDGAAARDD